MTAPSLLERAKTGDAQAIAALIHNALRSKRITVQGERQDYCLILRLRGQTLPAQAATVACIRRGLEQLQIASIGVVKIYGESTDYPAASWSEEVSLLGALADSGSSSGAIAASTASLPAVFSVSQVEPANHSVEAAYQQLELSSGASLDQVTAAYFQRKAALRSQGHRHDIESLHTAYQILKDHLQRQLAQLPETQTEIAAAEESAVNHISEQLQQQGFPAQVAVRTNQLYICLPAARVPAPDRATALVYTCLDRQDLVSLGLAELATVVICGLSIDQKVIWQRTTPMPRQGRSADDTDLFSFNNRHSITFLFPGLLVAGMLMNAMPLVSFLLRGIRIWFHEFGHATVAWMAGRRAIPLPIGWTNVDPERSLLVYGGVLGLLGLMFWAGRREQRRWPMVLAIGLMVIQFWMTWILSAGTFDMLLAFGGIGGEFYLCTLLMVSFYFPLPNYWRWDAYRYPVVLGAAFTFWGQFWLWKQVARGRASIPWGSLWGGENTGDMNILSNVYHWSPQRIIDTYNAIGNLCLLALLGVYCYFCLKQNRHYWFALYQRWLAR